MLSLGPHFLSRTSSMSSLGSDDSIAGGNANSSTSADTSGDGAVKRTRKRFTSVQLSMLEHLYRKVSHPTREQREEVAKEADIDIRSVTVWFQNKRQADRRMHRQLSEPSCSPSPTTSLPPSSPFSDASGNTIHTVRARTCSFSGNSSSSVMSAISASASASASRKRDRDHDAIPKTATSRQVRHKPSRQFSLDDIAARAERPALLPRTPPQCLATPSPSPSSASASSSSSPPRPQTPEPHPLSVSLAVGAEEADGQARALWENMPSSPVAPDPIPRPERDFVRYGSRRLTLEYACAREMVGVRDQTQEQLRVRGDRERERKLRKDKEWKKNRGHDHNHRHGTDAMHKTADETRSPRVVVREEQKTGEDEDEVPVADWDMHGDTDTEGVLSEAPVTPSSSFEFGELSVVDEQQAKNKLDMDISQDHPVTIDVKVTTSARDEDMMDAAYILYNLSQRG